jgi:hypothetical protein
MVGELNSVNFKKLSVRVGAMAQIVEHLPSKCEALSSNPHITMGKIIHVSVLTQLNCRPPVLGVITGVECSGGLPCPRKPSSVQSPF